MVEAVRKRGSWRGNALLAVTAVIAAVALAEGVLRFIEAREFSPEITYERLRGYSTIDLGRLNYNEDKVSRAKEKGTYRLLSFGDSFAYTIVQPPHTYHKVAARIASESTGRPWRIVNLGEPAVSFYQYMKAYKVWGALLEHDGAIFNIYLGNDLLEVSYDWVGKDEKINRVFLNMDRDLRTGAARGVTIPAKFPFRLLDYAYAVYLSAAGKIEVPPVRSRGQYNFAQSDIDEATWLETLRLQLDNFDPGRLRALRKGFAGVVRFAAFLAEVGKHGKQVVVIVSPNQVQVDEAVLRRATEGREGKAGKLDLDLSAYLIVRIFETMAPAVPVIYLRPVLTCAAHEGLANYYKTDSHWSVEGNRVVGEFLGAWLARRLSDSNAKTVKFSTACAEEGLRYGERPSLPDTPERVAAYANFVRPLISAASRGQALQ
jgi:SGNH hydrolase-like domain, acetyltransferase AlgX